MFTVKKYLYGFSLGIITIGLSSSQLAFARNHHKRGPPPPVVAPKDTHLNPKQSENDMTPFAQQAVTNAQQVNPKQNAIDKSNAPAALIPRRYASSSAKKVNGSEGWVNSKHRKSKYDLGINAPVAQTADPTQNKTRGVFRRAMPVYDPSY
ncbi:hypothetical protein HK18_08700 [Commensalibacter intestini]|uniref:Uncharacterized protein n=1 Tax=Commensalibacter intestini TaxID=479936 RepID=A0A251ZV78_9PROT|nr:hypothetical protein [Commensalibacter intestini]OUI78565.1 hypothetical protein HK18_08700 [Commensalibacter intestini]